MNLLIMRHGHAEPFAASDRQRALTELGRAQVHSVCKQRQTELQGVQRLIFSPYVRAQQTAELVSGYLPETVGKHEDKLFVPSASVSSAVERLYTLADGADTLMLVSHLPLVGDLLELLIGRQGLPPSALSFNTAKIVSVTCDPVAAACGEWAWEQQAQ